MIGQALVPDSGCTARGMGAALITSRFPQGQKAAAPAAIMLLKDQIIADCIQSFRGY
jgi:hypothetical protein